MELLEKQLAFLIEADKLKCVERMTRLVGGGRRENSAEHSWHVALMTLTLAPHSNVPIDLPRTLSMLLIHDLVEIDAGDSFVYDTVAMADKAEREQAAATRIFGLLPADQATHYRALWDEFEAQETPEAKFAAAVDRLAGMLPNYQNEGGTWREHSVSAERVRERNAYIAEGSESLWNHVKTWVDDAVARGWLNER
jgi:putative hydrolase of HD superfamily